LLTCARGAAVQETVSFLQCAIRLLQWLASLSFEQLKSAANSAHNDVQESQGVWPPLQDPLISECMQVGLESRLPTVSARYHLQLLEVLCRAIDLPSCTLAPLSLFPKSCAFFSVPLAPTGGSGGGGGDSSNSSSATNASDTNVLPDAETPTFDLKTEPMVRAARKNIIGHVLERNLDDGLVLADVLQIERNDALVEFVQRLYGVGGALDARANELLALVSDKTILCTCCTLAQCTNRESRMLTLTRSM